MRILCGKTLAEIANSIFGELSSISKHRVFIVVPDRFSQEAEKMMLEHEPNSVTFTHEITTLARLSRTLLDNNTTSIQMHPCSGNEISTQTRPLSLSRTGCVMAVAHCMHELGDELVNLSAKYANITAESIFDTLSQLMSSDITLDKLDTIQNNTTTHSALFRKLCDLKLIYKKYLEFLSRGYRDENAQILDAINAVSNCNIIKSARFYFLGFDSVTPSSLRFITEIAKVAIETTFGVIDNKKAYGISSILEYFRDCAHEKYNYMNSNIKTNQNNFDAQFELLDIITSDRKVEKVSNIAHRFLDIIQISSTLSAAKFISRDIIYKVRKEGKRYKDFCVTVQDSTIISSVLAEYGIPINFDCIIPLQTHPLTKLILSIISAISNDISNNSIRSIAHNPLLGISDENFFEWDDFVQRFGITHSMHRTDYKIYEQADTLTKQSHIVANSVRIKLISLLTPFFELSKGSLHIDVFVEKFLNLLENLVNPLAEFHSEFLPSKSISTPHTTIADQSYFTQSDSSSISNAAFLDFGNQVPQSLLTVLENISLLNCELDIQEFERILIAGINSVQIRVAPTLLDAVNILTPQSFGFAQYKTVYWFGADQDNLPTIIKDCGLIKDDEIEILHEQGLYVDPKVEDVNTRSYNSLLSTFFVTEKIIAVTGLNNTPPNSILQKLIFNTRECKNNFKPTQNVQEIIKNLPNVTSAAEEFLNLYNEAKLTKQQSLSPTCASIAQAINLYPEHDDIQTITHADELFFQSGTTNVSQLETFYSCPYLHFVKYGLGCVEPKTAQIQARDFGTILHAVAQEFALNTPKEKAECSSVALSILDRLQKSDEHFQNIDDYSACTLERIKKESIAMCNHLFDFATLNTYKTIETESKIGTDKYPGLKIGKAQISLCGYIDRIDTLTKDDCTYVMIIDYKTGNIDAGLNSVFFGKKLQLFAYMKALSIQGFIPTAALYFPVNDDFVSKKDTSDSQQSDNILPCSGWISADYEIIKELDVSINFEGEQQVLSSRFLPCELSKTKAKTNEFRLNGDSGLSIEQWNLWLDYVENLAGLGVDTINAGFIRRSPISLSGHLPCDYCRINGGCTPYPHIRNHNIQSHRPSVDSLQCKDECECIDNDDTSNVKGGDDNG